jgi:hypothetical protein
VGLRACAAVWAADLRALLRKLLRRAGSSLLIERCGVAGGLAVELTGGDAGARAVLADALAAVFAGKFDVLRVPTTTTASAQRARTRGMLVVGHGVAAAAPPVGAAPTATADVVFALQPQLPGERQLAALLAEIWPQF